MFSVNTEDFSTTRAKGRGLPRGHRGRDVPAAVPPRFGHRRRLDADLVLLAMGFVGPAAGGLAGPGSAWSSTDRGNVPAATTSETSGAGRLRRATWAAGSP